MTRTLNPQHVFKLLSSSNWTYEHCGDRIKDGDMDEYINEIEDGLSLSLVEKILSDNEVNIIADFVSQFKIDDINNFAAYFIADYVAQQIVNCVYPSVTFIACI